ncbi:right-handed parallel beta-helix repeat-containing protein [Candidatus Micrarchaeota archaeon]|nr:right-handed parallel beta-helix repeat-containing protein [Candidatus Micrarchaeota archaeon]
MQKCNIPPFLVLMVALIMSAASFSYYEYGGALYCNTTCDDCEDALNNATYTTVYLNSSLSSPGATCISNPSGFSNKVFDCQGNTITGTGSGYGIYIYSPAKTNLTIKNCQVSGFNYNVYARYLSYSHLDNLTIFNSSTDTLYIRQMGNSTISNTTACNSSHEAFGFDYSGDTLIINNTFCNATQQALEVRGSINNTFIYNNFYNATAGIDFHYAMEDYLYNTIANNTIYDVYRGIALAEGFVHNLIVNNTITSLAYCPLDSREGHYLSMEYYYASSCDNTIENNTGDGRPIYHYHDEAVDLSDFEAAELMLCNADDSTVQNVTLIGGGGGLFSMFSDNLIVNSSYSYNASCGFRINYCAFTLVNSVAQENAHRDVGISPYSEAFNIICDQLNITNVTGSGGLPINFTNVPVEWSDFESSQVILCGANYSNISGMTVSGSSTHRNNGVDLYSAYNINISSSTSDSNFFGFHYYYCHNIWLYNSSASGNAADGIYAYSYPYSNNLSIIGNTANGNGEHGIYLWPARDSTISSNTASDNEFSGINVDYESSNITVDSNTASGNGMEGIGVYSSFNVTVSNNRVYSNGDSDSEVIADDPFFNFDWFPYPAFAGIRIEYSDSSYSADITLANNTVYGNEYYGIVANLSDNVSSTNDRVYGNGLAEIYAGTDGTAREVYFTAMLLDSSDYPNVTISDRLDSSTAYTIAKVSSPNTNYPGGTAVQNRLINVTYITGSPTIDSLTWAWGNPEQNDYDESTFDLWRYVISWVDLNATSNTASNELNYSSISTAGVYGMLGTYFWGDTDDGGNGPEPECESDSDCGTCEECSRGECILPSGACRSVSGCTGAGYLCISCECVPPECISDSDCNEGYECEDYECVEIYIEPECASDQDCGGCEECIGGECVLPSGVCLSDSECAGEGEVCESCGCVPPECTRDSDCTGEGESCVDYACILPECTTDSECAQNEECSDYACVENKSPQGGTTGGNERGQSQEVPGAGTGEPGAGEETGAGMPSPIELLLGAGIGVAVLYFAWKFLLGGASAGK